MLCADPLTLENLSDLKNEVGQLSLSSKNLVLPNSSRRSSQNISEIRPPNSTVEKALRDNPPILFEQSETNQAPQKQTDFPLFDQNTSEIESYEEEREPVVGRDAAHEIMLAQSPRNDYYSLHKGIVNIEENYFQILEGDSAENTEQCLVEDDPNISEQKREDLIFYLTDEVLEYLLEEIFSENFHFDRSNKKTASAPQTPEPQAPKDSMYAIRTNLNAVSEYTNLLIDFLLENLSEYLIDRFNKGVKLNSKDIIAILREEEAARVSSEDNGIFLQGNTKARTIAQLEPLFLEDGLFYSLEDEILVRCDSNSRRTSKIQRIWLSCYKFKRRSTSRSSIVSMRSSRHIGPKTLLSIT